MKRCAVYRRRGKLLVAPGSRTVDGFWLTHAPYTSLDVEVSEVELGEVVVGAISLSARDIPTPDWKNGNPVMEALLDAAGVKSHSTFMKGAELVEVEVEEEWARLIPMINKGGRGGFGYPADTTVIHARMDHAAELGRKVFEALNMTTKH